MKKFLALAIVAVMTVALFAVGAQAEDFSYAHFVASGDDPCSGVTFSGAHTNMDPDAVKWAAIKYRTVSEKDSGGAALTGQIYVQPAQEPCVKVEYNHTQNWETLVLDLSGCAAWNSEKYTQTNSIRFDFLQGNKVQDGDSIDIAWIAFFENEADAKAYNGTQDTPYCVSTPTELAAKAGTNQVKSIDVVAAEASSAADVNHSVVEAAGGVGVWLNPDNPNPVTVKFTTTGAFTGINFNNGQGGYWASCVGTGTGPEADWVVELYKFAYNTENTLAQAPAAKKEIHSIGDSNPAFDFTFDSQPAGTYIVKVYVTNLDHEEEVGGETRHPYVVLPAITNPDDTKFEFNGRAFNLVVIGEDKADFFAANPEETTAPADTPDTPDNPGTADAAVIAIAAVACLALAGVVVAKKVR